MEIKVISSSAEIGCLNCIWFRLLDEVKDQPAEGICYLTHPNTITYTDPIDRCPQGFFLVKHRYYGYDYRHTAPLLVMEKEGSLIKDEDPIETYPCDSEDGPTGWCDK